MGGQEGDIDAAVATTRWVVAESDVAMQERDGFAFLLHLRTSRYFSLNRSGVVAWHALCKGEDPVIALSGAFPEIEPERLNRDWEVLRDRLVAEQLIRPA